jgi:rhodanese-related sulfurtransferase
MFGNYSFKNVDVDFLNGQDTQSAGKEAIHLIDIRSEAEISRGAIGGAQHIPMHLLPLRIQDIPKDKPVVLYCHSGARSAQACAWLSSQGFENMHNLSGGILAWARAGMPIV